MFGLSNLFGVPNFLTREAEKQIQYLTSDQEAEGRELGIKKAAEIYSPILKDLEIVQNELLEELEKSGLQFDEKAECLSKQVEVYERKILELEEAICKMGLKSAVMSKVINSTIDKPKYRKKISVDEKTCGRNKKLEDMIKLKNNYRSIRTDRNSINRDMPTYKKSQRNFSVGVDIVSWTIEFMPIKFFSDYLEEKMEKKRQEFFKKELVKQAKVWEEKIESVKKEMDKLYLRLISLESSNEFVLNEIKMILDEVIYDYLEKFEQYNALKSVEKML